MSCCRSCSAGRSSPTRWRTAWGTGTAHLLLRVRAPQCGRRAAAVLESVVLRRQRPLAEPAGIAGQSHVSAGAGDAAGAGDEDQHRRALCRRLPGHALVVAAFIGVTSPIVVVALVALSAFSGGIALHLAAGHSNYLSVLWLPALVYCFFRAAASSRRDVVIGGAIIGFAVLNAAPHLVRSPRCCWGVWAPSRS